MRCVTTSFFLTLHYLNRINTVLSPRYTPVQQRWLRKYTNLLLVTIRDPIDRIVSAFNFHRFSYFKDAPHHHGAIPKWQEAQQLRSNNTSSTLGSTIFLDCFATVEELAKGLQANTNNDPATSSTPTTSPHCQHIARDLVQGKLDPAPCAHFYYNYQFYAKLSWTDKSKPVAVIRTESLWNDTARIESLLGGDPQTFWQLEEKQVKHTHGSESFGMTTTLSTAGIRAMCCALWQELQVYHDLVVAATNLKATEKVDTLQRILHHCGIRMFTTSTTTDVATAAGQDETILLSVETIVAGWQWQTWYHDSCTGVLWWT